MLPSHRLQADLGAVRAKGVYRFIGTLVGRQCPSFLFPLGSVAVCCRWCQHWSGFACFRLQDRTPRSYASFSRAIRSHCRIIRRLHAHAMFDVALSRLEEISIGIVCAAIAHSVFFPRIRRRPPMQSSGGIGERRTRGVQRICPELNHLPRSRCISCQRGDGDAHALFAN